MKEVVGVVFLLLSSVIPLFLASAVPRILTYEVVQEVPHSVRAFTEGLVFRDADGLLLESTGLSGGSKLLLYDSSMMKVAKAVQLPNRHFGEGMVFFNGYLFVLTWKNRAMHVFDRHSLKRVETQSIGHLGIHEGWGMTVDRRRNEIVVGDGSEILHFVSAGIHKEPEIVDHLAVKDCHNGMPRVKGLNELEILPRHISHGEYSLSEQHVFGAPPAHHEALQKSLSNFSEPSDMIWANVISTMCVAIINPVSGDVEAWLILDGIYDKWDPRQKVANVSCCSFCIVSLVRLDTNNLFQGIAYRFTDDSIWVTGKDWSKLFQIKVKEHPKPDEVNIKSLCTSSWRLGYNSNDAPGNSQDARRCS